MKIEIKKADNRGGTDIGWLKSKHSFSFGDYYNQENIHFGVLRVINDDLIAPNSGFGTHPHNNMEIITLILDGTLTHKDSMGNLHSIDKDEVQVMSAGSGITHSEYNSSNENPVELLQIWILPKQRNIKPRYDQRIFEFGSNMTTIIASGYNIQDELYIHQDAIISLVTLEEDQAIEYNSFKENKLHYIFNISGEIQIEDSILYKRDAAEISGTNNILIKSKVESKFLIFELPDLE